MRIGLVIYGNLDLVSGGYLYDRMLVQNLRAAGHEVFVVSIPWRDYLRHLSDNSSHGLYKQLATLPVDILLQDELNHPSLVWLNRRLQRQARYPIIAVVHHLRSSESHPPLAQILYRWIERQYVNHVDGFIFNSQTTRESVEQRLQNPRPSVVAYPSADHLPVPTTESLLEYLPTRCHNAQPLRILFIGNLIRRKGLHNLLNAVAQLPPPLWKLTIIGSLAVDPGYVTAIRQQINRLHLRDNVNLAGYLPLTEMVAYLYHHHVLAVPSYEGFGIVYLEAMGFGLPVVAATSGAAHEIVTHGQEGFLVVPEEADTLAKHLRSLYKNNNELLRMSCAARARFDAHPTWSESAEKVKQFLESMSDWRRSHAINKSFK